MYNKSKGVYSEATDFTAQIINANDTFVRNEMIAKSLYSAPTVKAVEAELVAA